MTTLGTSEPTTGKQTAADQVFVALLSSDAPMPDGGWYSLIDRVGAEAVASLTRERDDLYDLMLNPVGQVSRALGRKSVLIDLTRSLADLRRPQ
jgi:hypothetical protein